MTVRARILIFLCLLLWAPPALTEQPVPRALPIDRSGGAVPLESGFIGDLSYEDESIRVVLEKTTVNETTCFVGHITIAHPSQLRSEAAGKSWQYGRASKGEKLAQRVNAVLAINGDSYLYRSRGYVVRQGVVLRKSMTTDLDLLLIDTAGDFHALRKPTRNAIRDALTATDVAQCFAFGPVLVMDGQVQTVYNTYGFSPQDRSPRTAIGQVGPLSYVFVVVDGRQDGSRGVTHKQLAAVMGELGCTVAYNLDGGGSSTLVFHGKVFNSLSEDAERLNSDILYVGTGVAAP